MIVIPHYSECCTTPQYHFPAKAENDNLETVIYLYAFSVKKMRHCIDRVQTFINGNNSMNKKVRTGRFILLILLITFMITAPVITYSQENKLSLSKPYSLETLKEIIIYAENWKPYPTADDRDSWLSIPEDIRQGHITLAEKSLGHEWPPLPATLFLEFARNGNRSNYQGKHFARRRILTNLIIAECMEGKGRFIDDIVNGIWALCEESYWGVPAHIFLQKKAGLGLPDVSEPTIDLFAAETGALLSWTYYLLKPQLDRVSPLICTRIEQEIERRIIIPFLNRDDFVWMGFLRNRRVHNWNPWCNSNCLTAGLIFIQDKNRRAAFVKKTLTSLDRFIDAYAPDGGCDEGPLYWTVAGGALFDCLELLKSVTNNTINYYNEPLIREIGKYIYRVHIAGNYFINFADAPARMSVSRGNLVWRYGKSINDSDMKGFGAYAEQKELARTHTVSGNAGRQLAALFTISELLKTKPYQPLLRDVWFQDIQVMAAREREGSSEGLYLAAKGGHNDESHNHNDIGNFIVYADSSPVIIDVGQGTYTRKTFSSERYTIWMMQSAYHNLPAINGVMQKNGREFKATNVSYKSNNSYAQLSLDIASAYPPEAQLNSWVRTVRLNRGKNIEITDSYSLKETVNEITLSLMTPCPVTVQNRGTITLKNGSTMVSLIYNAAKITPDVETINIEDGNLKSVLGNKIYRILFRAERPPLKDEWKLKISQ